MRSSSESFSTKLQKSQTNYSFFYFFSINYLGFAWAHPSEVKEVVSSFFNFAYIYDILLSDETRNSLQKYLA